MFRQLHRIAVTAGVSVALTAAMGVPAIAGAAMARSGSPGGYPPGNAMPGHPYAVAPGTRSASTPGPVNVAGTITWTIRSFFQGVTGGDTQTGTVYFGLTGLNFKNYTPARDTSTYSVTDNTDESWSNPVPGGTCNSHLTGSFSGGGSLAWIGNKQSAYGDLGFTFHPKITYVSVSIGVPYTETQTTTWTGPPGSGCNTTTTGTVHSWLIPGCVSKTGGGLGLTGTLKGTFPTGTVNLSCSGTYHDPTGPGSSWKVTGTLAVSTHCVPPNQLSDLSWVDQFPDSKVVSALADPFQQNVTRFINAMDQAGITVHVISTRRPLQRAYLMHYSWRIAKGKINPKNVPKFNPGPGQPPVNICWVHTNSSGTEDLPASVAAAQQMVKAYHIDPKLPFAPALNSLHTAGLAIDMTTTWDQPTITIVDGSGHAIPINTTPHSGLNTQLMAVGLTYFVHHFCYPPGTCQTKVPANDANHWSVNGH